MRIGTRIAVVAAVTGIATTVGGTGAFALTHGLKWNFPQSVTSGQAVQVASIQRCPAPPTPGDRVVVQITITFTGGGMGQILSTSPNRSWSGNVTFTFSNVPSSGTITAACQDYNGISATPYANYTTHSVTLVG